MKQTWDQQNNRIILDHADAAPAPAVPDRNSFRVDYAPLDPREALGWFVLRMLGPGFGYAAWLLAAAILGVVNRGDNVAQAATLTLTGGLFGGLILYAGYVAHDLWTQTRDYHAAAYNRMLPTEPDVRMVAPPTFAAPSLSPTERKFAKFCYLLWRAHPEGQGDATIIRSNEQKWLQVEITGDKIDQAEQIRLQKELAAMQFLVGGKGQKWEIDPRWASRPLDQALTALQDLFQERDWSKENVG